MFGGGSCLPEHQPSGYLPWVDSEDVSGSDYFWAPSARKLAGILLDLHNHKTGRDDRKKDVNLL